jgi:dTDP-4-amino-4,6-dideoxygalactose transaminase
MTNKQMMSSGQSGKIAFLDLVSPHEELEKELVAVFQKALRTAGFIGGPMLEEFERSFADFCEARFAIGVNSGTDALRFALMAAGVRKGDSVVTVPNTFIATTEAISQTGAGPEFIDVDERTYNMNPEKLREFLEQRCSRDRMGRLVSRNTGRPVTAIVPVHLYGQSADMDPIQELADRYELVVIEDACQAHGAEYFSKRDQCWKKIGSIGNAAAFSFYPGKNLGACGEAGIVTTNDEETAAKIRMIRDHGQAKKYYHDMEGYNGRLDSLQAGILSVKLKYLPGWNQSRRERARKYNDLFAGTEAKITTPFEPSWSKAVYHLYVVQVENREEVQAALGEQGIGTGIHYPIPLHLQRAYTHLGYRVGDFPVCERAAHRILSLPMFPTISASDQARTAQAVARTVQRATARAVAAD